MSLLVLSFDSAIASDAGKQIILVSGSFLEVTVVG